MLAIFKREFKSYFQSFIGFLFVAVTLALIGLYFFIYNLGNGYPYFQYVLSSVSVLFMFTVPILTMRTLAEEKRNKTDQLTLTAPVSVWSIVMGKYLALLGVFCIPVLVICFYPLILMHFGTIPVAQAYLAILGYFLFGAAAIAVGLFVSSLTESPVIAAVIGIAVLFVGYMMKGITSLLDGAPSIITQVLNCFDLYTHFSDMLNGSLNIDGIVYYISLIVLVLFFTVQSIQKRRYSVSVNHLSLGAYSTISIVIATAIVVVLNIVVAKLPKSFTAVDVTDEQLYSITDEGKEFIAQVDEDVKIYVLSSEDNRDLMLGETLDRIDDLSKFISVEYVDPAINPRFASQYTDENLTVGSLIVVSDKRSTTVSQTDIYESTFDSNTYSSTVTGYDGEGRVISAIDFVTSDRQPKLLAISGHGEAPLSNNYQDAIKKANIDYETGNIMDYDEISEDIDMILINAPTSDISKDDLDKLKDYLEKGGDIIYVATYDLTDSANIDELLSYRGLSTVDGVVVEGDESHYYGYPFYLLPNVQVSTYTKGIYGGAYYVFAPNAQGILIDDTNEEVEYASILSTTDSAYSKLAANNMEVTDKEEGDIDGPFQIGVAAEKTGEGTLVVYGSSFMFTDDATSLVGGSNQTLFTNTASSFASRSVNVSIPVKSYSVSNLIVPKAMSTLIGALTAIVVPVALLIAGFCVWFARRKK
ncbi:MAG: Gldg family protein [Acetatifactor sp.]|nr:Gldg family protein [Acetatifactor sp.]